MELFDQGVRVDLVQRGFHQQY